jgi:hypothetical protein
VPEDDTEKLLSDKNKTISLAFIPRLDRPTIVSDTGEVIVFVRDLPGSASAILHEKAAIELDESEENHVDDAGEATENKEEGKEGKKVENYGESESFYN